ncbi:MAG: AAA family ATPase [Ignavibacteriales bacterium]|nr:AAA family ATPase [Ignavibacteriales bacterium]
MLGQAQRIFELKNSLVEPKNPSRSTPIISFTSGKGGTGKSFLCLNVAYQLAQLGKKVLVVDFDLNFSNVHVMLNIIPEKTLFEFFSSECLLNELIYKYDKKLEFIFGFSGFEPRRVTDNSIQYFWNQLNLIASEYDFVFIDVSSGANEDTLEILSQSDYCIVVANPEPTATMDAYAIIKLLNSSEGKNNIKIVINKYFSQEDAEIAFENLEKAVSHFLKQEISLLGSVSFDPEIVKSIMTQEIFLSHHLNTQSANQIQLIAQGLLNIRQVANNNQR